MMAHAPPRTPVCVIWIAGLPASGKTTLARRVVARLEELGRPATLVDSDEVRKTLTPHPTYEPGERTLVYRAIADTAQRLAAEGVLAVVAATANQRQSRDNARAICPQLLLVHAQCPLSVCEGRDPKGLYSRARRDPKNSLPGLGADFDALNDADMIVDTSGAVGEEAVEAVCARALRPP